VNVTVEETAAASFAGCCCTTSAAIAADNAPKVTARDANVAALQTPPRHRGRLRIWRLVRRHVGVVATPSLNAQFVIALASGA